MTPEGSVRDRGIVNARVIVTCPGRNFVTLRIETRSGIVGVGDATRDHAQSVGAVSDESGDRGRIATR